MIWFACKHCGKRHKQPDEAAGSLVFCECGRSNRVPWESTAPEPREAAEPAPRRGPRRRARREPPPRDPEYCLTHEEAPSVHTCPDCGESFCARCLVEFQGLRLCGPCKNYRVRKLQRRPQIAGVAIAALIAGLVCAPLIFCVTLGAIGTREPRNVFVAGIVGIVLGAAALVLGLVGLRQAEGATSRGGQGMAMTGAALGTAGLLWSLSLVIVMSGRVLGG
jgi:hypothetical protein